MSEEKKGKCSSCGKPLKKNKNRCGSCWRKVREKRKANSRGQSKDTFR